MNPFGISSANSVPFSSGLTHPGLSRSQNAKPDGATSANPACGLKPFQSHESYQEVADTALNSRPFRHAYVHTYGHALITSETLDALVDIMRNKKVLEVGAGTGYLAHELSLRHIDIHAVDDGSWCNIPKIWKRDTEGCALKMLPGDYDIVLMSWPNSNDFSFDVADAMKPGQMLIYEGEYRRGNTACDEFFDEVSSAHWSEETSEKLNAFHVQFDGMRDMWSVYTKEAPSAGKSTQSD